MPDVLPLRALPNVETSAEASNPPLLVGARELAVLLRIGLRTVRTMDAAGRLPRPVRLGGSVRWSLDEIRKWLQLGAPSRDEWEARRPSL